MRARGTSLLEMMIVLGIASLVVIAALGSIVSARSMTNELGVEHDLVSAADRGLAVLEDDLRNTSLDPAAGLAVTNSYTLTFSKCTGFDTTTNQPIYSPPVTYQFFSVPPQGDGIKGECQLCRSFNGSAWQDVMIRGIAFQENGVAFVPSAGFGLASGSVTVNFYVARNVVIPQTGRRDVRYRAVSRTYRIPGAAPAAPSAPPAGTGGTGGTGTTTSPPPKGSPPPPKKKKP